MTAGGVEPEIWQELLNYRPSHVVFILGRNNITLASDPQVIYHCIGDRIYLIQAEFV